MQIQLLGYCMYKNEYLGGRETTEQFPKEMIVSCILKVKSRVFSGHFRQKEEHVQRADE